MFKNLYELDEFDTVEHNLVAEAANRLEIGEFQLFQLGYAAWFGSDPDPKTLEQAFFSYLMEHQIPHWARHYARNIVDDDDRGLIDIYDEKFHRFDQNFEVAGPAMKRRWINFIALSISMLVLIIGSALGLQAMLKKNTGCLYPPCIYDYNQLDSNQQEENQPKIPTPLR